MAIRVILADDHRMLRDALTVVLSREPDIEVAAVADDGHTALAVAREHKPDVMVIDVAMPAINGVAVVQSVRNEAPNIQILALSAYADSMLVQETLRAGAAGYVSKLAPVTELASAIRAVAKGQVYLSPEVTAVMVRQFSPHLVNTNAGNSPLTPRERQVLRLVAQGARTSAIAKRLNITEGTVEAHRRNLMRKLNLRTVAELTKYAVRVGLASL
jgi:DNA-binding NarL/FixJ family response regulator